MDLGGASWLIIDIVGGFLLAAVLFWALLRNRRQRGSLGRSEQATRDLYDREEADRRDGTDGR
jgi:FtsZ-interacting cell division protein ZipA